MRMGLQVSADRGRYATKVEKLQADARWADEAGLDSVWTPQIPDEFDVMTAATLIGTATSRIEVGTAIVPLQPRHPIVLAQQALSNQAVCEGRFTLGLGVSHRWIIEDMLGLPYERGATTMRCYLDVLDQALRGPGMVDVQNELFTIHNPLDITDIAPTPVMIAALGPVMRPAPRSGWPTSAPSGPTSSPPSRRRPRGRAARRHGSWPASRSASAGTTRSRRPWRARTAR
jgi:alkanesulfonate monooxygenase SsuD/methylene tetrahydromethanopterin reductase-like flavin-dependent oxidoreductase (luciferase family)